MKFNKDFKLSELKDFLIFWLSQTISQLGTSLTSLALTLWLYEKTGSSLSTASLTIVTYIPYVIISIFAGAVTDRLNKKKTILICDSLAACGTLIIYLLYKNDCLLVWHIYLINFLSGIMNTIQSPASEVANSILVDKKYYQLTASLSNLSRSLISVIGPIISTTIYAFFKLEGVITIDLISFAIAFVILLLFIKIPDMRISRQESFIDQTKQGFTFLKDHGLVLNCILFMSMVNLIASAFDAALPGFVIPNPKGGNIQLGIVNSAAGLGMIFGSLVSSVLPKPKDRVRVVYLTMLFSLVSENLILPLTRLPISWCVMQFIGWSVVPIMSTNLNVIMRNEVPVDMQGRIFACRNSLQYFTIPIGLFLGGFFVDEVCEPFMASNTNELITKLFSSGKGSGAGLFIFILGIFSVIGCLLYERKLKQYKYVEE